MAWGQPGGSYLFVAGTRPEAIKLAPLIRAVRDDGCLLSLLASGQQHELLHAAFANFDIAPDVDFGPVRDAHAPHAMFSSLLPRLFDRFTALQPAAVIVQGDTTTAYAAAHAAAYSGLPLVHVEAGLRTGESEPFPEEMHRRVIGQLAALHCAPTAAAAAALRREGVARHRVHVTGNTGVDAVLWMARRLDADPRLAAAARAELPACDPRRPLIVATVHRRENHARIAGICAALAELSADADILIPVHPHPAIAGPVRTRLWGYAGVHLTEPLSYPAFVLAVREATLVLTDSGGVQEEGPALGTPVLVMRHQTERREGVASGNTRLIGTEPETIVAAARALLADPALRAKMARPALPYGRGDAALRIAALLRAAFPLDAAGAELRHQPREVGEAGRHWAGVVNGHRSADMQAENGEAHRDAVVQFRGNRRAARQRLAARPLDGEAVL
jgi:UDP-N-acetylglucosamine 2-epimerase (non-hydrolysing)